MHTEKKDAHGKDSDTGYGQYRYSGGFCIKPEQFVPRYGTGIRRVLFRLALVDPAYTSRTCPSCGTVDKRNRQAEKFKCTSCGYSQHADVAGALNILTKGLSKVRSLESLPHISG